MERYYSKFVIEKVQGRLTIPMQDIKKGCLLNNKNVEKFHSDEAVFLTKEEALEAFKCISLFHSYSLNVHHIVEYVLMEVVYEVIDEDEEHPVEYKTIETSNFIHLQAWVVGADGKLRFDHIVRFNDGTAPMVRYREGDTGCVLMTLDGRIYQQFRR